MKAIFLDENNVVINFVEVDNVGMFPNCIEWKEGVSLGDIFNYETGEFNSPEQVVPLPTQEEYTAAIQQMMDYKAKERNYDGILSACTYATSTIEKFKTEGQACVNWRDKVWQKSYQLMAEVSQGVIPQPTITEILAMLPLMEWPE